MSLLDEIHQEQASRRKGPRCGVCQLLDTMSDADRVDLEAALDDSTVYASVIVRALSKRDIVVRDSTVSRHRQKRCAG